MTGTCVVCQNEERVVYLRVETATESAALCTACRARGYELELVDDVAWVSRGGHGKPAAKVTQGDLP